MNSIMENRYKHFDAATVALEGSNLIEASAGTGKTYSIAILVLRLVLEKKISVKEILMVTFTTAAVAELHDRIRLFIRKAYKVSFGYEIDDDNITSLVLNAIEQSDPVTINQLLRDAVLLLDETAVLTIHSFCQQTLNEFAFETDQLFDAQMVPDTTSMVEHELNKFWRKYVTTLSSALLNHLWTEEMKDNIQKVLQEHLSGKKYLGFDENEDYTISARQQEDWMLQLQVLSDQRLAAAESLQQYFVTHKEDLTTACESNANARKSFLELVSRPKDFIKKLRETKAQYVQKLFPDLLELIAQVDSAGDAIETHNQAIRRQLNYLAIREVEQGVKIYKERNNMQNYDDLITNLNTALVERENPNLVAALQQKYKAVFVDEFQDTDREQYEIFNRAFGENTILFYIGDPKQSIYAWRKADIFTYFNARNSVQHLYDMNHNYRSSENMIAAMNLFFKPTPDFDTFDFTGEHDSIAYIPVESPDNNSKGFLYKGEEKAVPVTVFTCKNKDEIVTGVATQVAQLLLNPGYRLVKETATRQLSPADIGILVRTTREGREIKHKLALMGIPAVNIDEAKVLDTAEAQEVLYLLEAMETPERSTINRALLSPFTGFSIQDILQLDNETTLNRFGKYREQWLQHGAYTALMAFIADFGVRNVLLEDNTENGERIITNLLQLTELVHQVQSRKNLSMRDLISWLKRGIDGMATEGDEYAQRVESDEEAVNIVTIHKSKGLEYKIVLAPFLDLVENKNIEFISFRDPDTGDYLNAEKSRLTAEQQHIYRQQLEQENRRLLYVAITRAVYKCYLYKNTYHTYKTSTLATFLHALGATVPDPALIDLTGQLPEKPEQLYRRSKLPAGNGSQAAVSFSLQEENWRKMSYTMLAAKPEQKPRIRTLQQEDAYDNFIFNTLRRGAKTGNLLHFIFENINFSDNAQWEYWLDEAILRFVPGQREIYLPMLYQLLEHVMHTTIEIDNTRFQLASVGRHQRMAEFEFDFPVPVFQANLLNELSDDELTVNIRQFPEYSNYNAELEGIMNGKIDLFFEYNRRYYILDWKSNYLGSTVEDYAPPALAAAMNENNYHLQYLIYTVAVKKYLESRLEEFDYETQFGGVIYCFVRGVRNTGNYGIFTAKPAVERIALIEDMLTEKNSKLL
ncbi:exodeoxyribonuclease V subunit beta [Chitinophaga sp. Mgbs1]|uniref:RecBCD enzyme subunit RecB n=1 Tax=Chitinophaga solisilvae TaxID=1233460 RepID=A0A3S1B1Q6_9BACT|nr:exodeoxyribonuclease V subunit beta [Chitinophaga solisilvae]